MSNVVTMFLACDTIPSRWLSRDPIAEAGGLNLYGYVSNNPISLNDPLGECGIFDSVLNLLEQNDSLDGTLNQEALAMGDSLGGMLAGNWDYVETEGYNGNPLQLTEDNPFAYNIELTLIGISGASALGAGVAILLPDAAIDAGISGGGALGRAAWVTANDAVNVTLFTGLVGTNYFLSNPVVLLNMQLYAGTRIGYFGLGARALNWINTGQPPNH